MRAFLWTIAVLFAFSAFGRAFWLSVGRFPDRSKAGSLFELILEVALLCWVIALLAGDSCA